MGHSIWRGKCPDLSHFLVNEDSLSSGQTVPTVATGRGLSTARLATWLPLLWASPILGESALECPINGFDHPQTRLVG